jgi:hypothetical protein
VARVSNPSALGAIEYEPETNWAENVTTFATHRIPILGAVDCSGLVHTKAAPERVVQYRNDGTQWVLMTMGGSFKTRIDWPGHGASTAGAPTLDAIETYLGYVFGNAALSAAASTTLTGGTATVPITAASGTFSAGGLCRVGAGGLSADGRGNGQFYPLATHVTTTLTLLAALDGAPSNGDVLYPVAMFYPSESPTATAITGLRFRLLTANLRYECHGCYPMSVTFTGLSPGERPQIEVTWGVSWWAYSTATFPSTVASNQYNPAPIAAGSLFVQTLGTATRAASAKRVCRSFSIEHTLGIEVLKGPGGVSPYQDIVGARRTPDRVKWRWTEDADAATATPVLPGYGTGTTFLHAMWTGSCSAGSAIGAYARRLCVSNVAVQRAENNINRLSIEAEAYTGTTTTSDLTLACVVYGSA